MTERPGVVIKIEKHGVSDYTVLLGRLMYVCTIMGTHKYTEYYSIVMKNPPESCDFYCVVETTTERKAAPFGDARCTEYAY